jgi:hypothetical protein
MLNICLDAADFFISPIFLFGFVNTSFWEKKKGKRIWKAKGRRIYATALSPAF